MTVKRLSFLQANETSRATASLSIKPFCPEVGLADSSITRTRVIMSRCLVQFQGMSLSPSYRANGEGVGDHALVPLSWVTFGAQDCPVAYKMNSQLWVLVEEDHFGT
jgi:hypothetical protein